jgi:hypothetical protein
VLADEASGFDLGQRVMNLGTFHMTIINRALAFGRSLLTDEVGASSTRLALMIGLSASAVLVIVRVGTAVAGGLH